MFKKLLFFIIIWLPGYHAAAQYFHFSQYDFTPLRVNPALAAASDYAGARLIYRNQRASEHLSLNSTALSGNYPLIGKNGGKRWSGVGFSFLDDRSGEGHIFRINEIGVTYAANIFLSRRQTLNAGVKVLYQSRRLALDALYTGQQYVPDRGFDLSLGAGESIDQLTSSQVSLSTGLHWQETDRHGRVTRYLGFFFFDFNQPNDSFFGESSTMPGTWVASGGYQVYHDYSYTIVPEVLVTTSAGKTTCNIGAVTSYDLRYSRGADARVNVVTKYVTGKYAIAGIQFEKENFKVGLGYDIPLSRQTGNNGALEVGLEIKQLIKSKNKISRKRNGKKKNVKARASKRKKNKAKSGKKNEAVVRKSNAGKDPQTSAEGDSEDRPSITGEAQKADATDEIVRSSDDLEGNGEPENGAEVTTRAGELERMPLLYEKRTVHFNFGHESAELDEESRLYLQDLTQILQQDPALMVTITGHTDNTGSENYNLKLSMERVEAVKAVLEEQGISPDRIKVSARGEGEPIFSNETPDGRAKNRRVEFLIHY